MKTKKVGKIVSLLLAIVLVATIMVPAVNVLADSAAQKYPGAKWIEASSFAELRTVLNNAKVDGTKTYVKLTGKIDLPAGARYVSNNNKGLFLGEVLKLDKLTPVVWSHGKDKWTASFGDAKSAEEAVNIINESKMAPASTVNPFDPDGKGEYADKTNFYIAVTRDNLNALENTFNFTETKYTNTKGTPDTSKDPTQVARDYPSYYDTNLIIPVGTDVVIDLNGQTIDGGQSAKAYIGTPDYIQSIFIVNGKLTVEDFVGGGKLTGATGYLSDGTYDVTKFQNGIEQRFDTSFKDRHRFVNANFDYTNESSHHNSETPSNIKDEKYNADTAAAWRISAIANGSSDGYTQLRFAYYIGGGTVTEVRGGAVYVSETGEFTLNNGSITRNCVWMESNSSDGTSAAKMMKPQVASVVRGGGVYVEAGGTFNMNGGEISKNAARAYQKNGASGADAKAYGGGVYLESGAVMTMTGGEISGNAAYAETMGKGNSDGNAKNTEAQGGGVYVQDGATCTIKGSASDFGSTDLTRMKAAPKVTSNTCGGRLRDSASNATLTIEGAGVYAGGTVNLMNALIGANDFAEGKTSDQKTVVHVMRDDADKTGGKPGTDTGLQLYVLDYTEQTADGTSDNGVSGKQQTPKTYITRLDEGGENGACRFTENLQPATEESQHEANGYYGTFVDNDNYKDSIKSNGAGVCVGDKGKLVIGERTWITDNMDLVTSGHKPFDKARDYNRYWAQTKVIQDDRVYKTNDINERGANCTDPAGGWIYYGTFNSNVNDGYAYSDTTDDVYLPDGQFIYKGDSLFESKIGVNYWNMVNSYGEVKDGASGQAGNRVFVKSSTGLDTNVWGHTSSTVKAADIQFFYANDNNKNWEKDNYRLPSPQTWTYASTVAYPKDKHTSWGAERVTAISATNEKININSSPYEGYINYDVKYPSGKWWYGWEAAVNQQHGNWNDWNEETYRISDPGWTPDDTTTKLSEFTNSVVNFPQRSYQLTAEMKAMNSSYLQAKYIDYKVVFDDSEFGKTSPVLRFGNYKDAERQMYVTINFDEAGKHYYGVNAENKDVDSKDSKTVSLTTDKNSFFGNIDAKYYFYGKDTLKPTGTIDIAKVVPDYNAYGKLELLKKFLDMGKNRVSELTSISKDDTGVEMPDLYFKGWQFYTSYEYGPEIVSLNKNDTLGKISGLNYRGYYTADLRKIFNSNVNGQPCPSMTAIWYTKEELAAARLKVSNVKYQIIKSADNKDLLRIVAIAGSDYPDFEAVGFVISTSNATPTIEGGYDYVANSDIYERLGVTGKDGTQMCYDVDRLLGGNYYGSAGNHSSIKIDEEFEWKFGDGKVGGASAFAQDSNISTGNFKRGYKDAGLFYTNILIDDNNRNTVYFVTPYASVKNNDGTYTYYYGESRAICYADYVAS